MPRRNPHLGETGLGPSPEARGWQAGYDAGVSSPAGAPQSPLTRDPDYMDAWAEGATAGNADGQSEGWRLCPVGEDADRPATRAQDIKPQSSGETGDTASAFGAAWSSVGSLPLRVLLHHVAPEADTFLTSQLAGSALNRALTELGGTDRLYLPVCLSPPHDLAGDPVLDAGYWHGSASESFDSARVEAELHARVRTIHFPGLVRYRSAGDHNFWDWIPLDQRDLTMP